MNKYLASLVGATSLSALPLQFCDVFGLDDELLEMIPKPLIALLLLYPITTENEAFGSTGSFLQPKEGGNSYFYTKQTVGNACGTIGILHALLNNVESLSGAVAEGSVLQTIQSECKGKSWEACAAIIEESGSLDAAHVEAAEMGETGNQDIDADINLHFVCITTVTADGGRVVVELDGRKKGPLVVGQNDEGDAESTLLRLGAKHIKQYMDLNPDRYDFTVVALCGV